MGEETKVADAGHLSDPHLGDAPQLGRAILETKAGAYPIFQTPLEAKIAANKGQAPIDLGTKDGFDAELHALLQHIQDRIRLGLAEAWLGPLGYAWRPPPGFGAETTEVTTLDAEIERQLVVPSVALYLCMADPDEIYARAITETFLFLTYGGPNVNYSHASNDANDLPEDKCFDNFPRWYPFSIACQHLATYAVLGRGVPFSDIGGKGLNCSGQSAKLPAFPEGVKFAKCGAWDGEPVTTKKIAAHMGPGDPIFFNFHGPDSGDQSPLPNAADIAAGVTHADAGMVHVGSVLRNWGGKVQFLDTGVLLSQAGAGPTEGGTSDHAWAAPPVDPTANPVVYREPSAYYKSVGVGIIGPARGDIKELARKIERARPIAVARLVIFDEQPRKVAVNYDVTTHVVTYREVPHRVRYASRLLHLWLGDGGIPLSKLIWSLRDPPVKGLRFAWFIYLPKGQWVQRFLDDDAVSKKPADLWSAGSGVEQNSLYDTNVVFSQDDGKVIPYCRFGEKTKDGDKSGWTREFGVEARYPSESIPWVAVRPEKDPPADDNNVTAQLLDTWFLKEGVKGRAYKLADPAALAGVEFDDPVGVELFDQGI